MWHIRTQYKPSEVIFVLIYQYMCLYLKIYIDFGSDPPYTHSYIDFSPEPRFFRKSVLQT